jgi:hypothetical protein
MIWLSLLSSVVKTGAEVFQSSVVKTGAEKTGKKANA